MQQAPRPTEQTSDTADTCLLCEDRIGSFPYPCSHRICEECLLKMQAERMYFCPYCRTKQATAAPSLEYKLLKLLVGVSDEVQREDLKDSLRAVMRGEERATERLNISVAGCAASMQDFPSKHYEAPDCLRMVQAILAGVMPLNAARDMLQGQSTPPTAQGGDHE